MHCFDSLPLRDPSGLSETPHPATQMICTGLPQALVLRRCARWLFLVGRPARCYHSASLPHDLEEPKYSQDTHKDIAHTDLAWNPWSIWVIKIPKVAIKWNNKLVLRYKLKYLSQGKLLHYKLFPLGMPAPCLLMRIGLISRKTSCAHRSNNSIAWPNMIMWAFLSRAIFSVYSLQWAHMERATVPKMECSMPSLCMNVQYMIQLTCYNMQCQWSVCNSWPCQH